MTVALPPPEDRSFADVWSALGGELKPSLDLVVSAPVETGQRLRDRSARAPAAREVSTWRGHDAAGRRASACGGDRTVAETAAEHQGRDAAAQAAATAKSS